MVEVKKQDILNNDAVAQWILPNHDKTNQKLMRKT
jgi:hypothetical protein